MTGVVTEVGWEDDKSIDYIFIKVLGLSYQNMHTQTVIEIKDKCMVYNDGREYFIK